jgi:phosphoribosylformimino-5-aminoimidazole carboxamide ribotide isomerase
MIDIIPALDLIDGKCVRLTHGVFARKTVYSDDPVEVAKRFADTGFRRLHMVDLDGARRGVPANLAVLERVSTHADLVIDFGGGIKTASDLESVFAAGAAIANVGSTAVKEPEKFIGWLDRFGEERLLLGADCKGEKIAVNGWQEETEISIFDFLENMHRRGLKRAFVTDIGRDGALAGPSIQLYERIIELLPGLELIASGGVSSIEDIVALETIGCTGVIVGKAIYEGRITTEELARYAR